MRPTSVSAQAELDPIGAEAAGCEGLARGIEHRIGVAGLRAVDATHGLALVGIGPLAQVTQAHVAHEAVAAIVIHAARLRLGCIEEAELVAPVAEPAQRCLEGLERVAGIDGRHLRRAGVLPELDQRNVLRRDQRRVGPLLEVDRAEAIVVDRFARGLDQLALFRRRSVAKQEMELAAVLVAPSQVRTVVLDEQRRLVRGMQRGADAGEGAEHGGLARGRIGGGKRLNGCEQQARPQTSTDDPVHDFARPPFGRSENPPHHLRMRVLSRTTRYGSHVEAFQRMSTPLPAGRIHCSMMLAL